MAIDQFGYELTEEERFRLMMEQQRMGLLPGLLGGPAVDAFSGIPTSLPAYGPAAGLGPSSYMGAPQGMPTYNQSPALAAPSLMVDAGMAPVDPTGGLAATDPNLQGVTPMSMAQVGTNAFGIPDRTYAPTAETVSVADPNSYPNMATAYPVTDPVSIMQAAQSVPDPVFMSQILSDTGITETPSTDTSPMSTVSTSKFVNIPSITTGTRVPIVNIPLGSTDYDAAQDAGMAEVISGTPNTTNASYGDPTLSGELGTGVVPYDRWGAVTPEEGEIHDVHRHMGLTMGVMPQEGPFKWGNLATQLPSLYRKDLRNTIDDIGDFLGDETTTDKLQDLINNQIAEDTDTSFTNQGLTQLEKYNQGVANPNVVYDKDSLNAMVALAKTDYYKDEQQVQDAIDEIVTQTDSFKDIPAPVVTKTSRKDLKAAAAAQRKADLAEQKAAARRTALAKQALKDSQAAAARAQAASAAQAQAAQNAARAVLARMGHDRNTPSQREYNAAMEVLSQIDTFDSGGQRGFMGAEIGREDGGGFTGGDFSGGAGWE